MNNTNSGQNPLSRIVHSTEGCFFKPIEDNHGNMENKSCLDWEELKISQPSGDFYVGC